jgi:hypothetical protein
MGQQTFQLRTWVHKIESINNQIRDELFPPSAEAVKSKLTQNLPKLTGHPNVPKNYQCLIDKGEQIFEKGCMCKP